MTDDLVSSGTGTEVHVAFATDSAYLPWCATAILSCLLATSEVPVRIHLFHLRGLQPADQERVANMVTTHGGTVAFHLVELDRLSKLPSRGAALGGKINWLRFLLPELLPELDRVLHLDADTLVTRSLTELWATPLQPFSLAAVRNVVEPAMRRHVEDIGIRDPRNYFNAGVLLMNLTAMRDQGGFHVVEDWVSRSSASLTWFDQDALNVIFAHTWLPLHPRWNAQNSFWTWHHWAVEVFDPAELHLAMAEPAILHFEGPGPNKPWHYLSQHPWRDQYLDTLHETPWHNRPVEGRTAANMIIGCLPRSVRIPAYIRWQRYERRLKARIAALRGRSTWHSS